MRHSRLTIHRSRRRLSPQICRGVADWRVSLARRGSVWVVRQQSTHMRTFATILLLTAGMFVNTSAQNTNSRRASAGSLEIVLNLQKADASKTSFYNAVPFSAAKEITMEVSFRNVGEVTMNCMDLLNGATVIWDGKEYKKAQLTQFILAGFSELPPKTAWKEHLALSL